MIIADLLFTTEGIDVVLGAQITGWIDYSSDTRNYRGEELFLAFTGEKYNAFNFIDPILKKGCKIVIGQSNDENKIQAEIYHQNYPRSTVILVKDMISYVQQLAKNQIIHWNKDGSKIVLGISGSNGKTTHKEMMAHILSSVLPGKSTWTYKNNNNHLGVPLTIFQLQPETEIIAIELGSNHPGEIKTLCDICLPNAGIVTNIGATHLEFFETEQNVFLEEGYLYWAVKENTRGTAPFLINADDKFLKNLESFNGARTFSSEGANAQINYRYRAVENAIEIKAENETIIIKNDNLTGSHNFSNLANSVMLLSQIFPHLKNKIIEAAQTFQPTSNRSQWVEFNKSQIFLDAYNANPSSMKSALTGFKEFLEAKKINLENSLVVLGDMKELGDREKEYHREVGKFLFQLGLPNAAFVGAMAQEYKSEFGSKAKCYANAAEFRSKNDEWQNYDYLFIKGSRSLQLESILDINKD